MTVETRPFDPASYLRDPLDQVAYVRAALEEDDPAALARALGDVARARGVAAFAREAGLSREAVYRAFGPRGNPTLDTLSKATRALGLRLTVVAA